MKTVQADVHACGILDVWYFRLKYVAKTTFILYKYFMRENSVYFGLMSCPLPGLRPVFKAASGLLEQILKFYIDKSNE